MQLNQQHLEEVTSQIRQSLGEQFSWQWEKNRQALLSEFARDKKTAALAELRHLFIDEWNKKTIKKAPKALKNQLGDLAKLSKEQLLFSSPANGNTPPLLAIWWPWGHGGTYSLRLMVLTDSYERMIKEAAQVNFLEKILSSIKAKLMP